MRSVATMSSRSGLSSYVSRTLPRAKSLSGRAVSVTGGPAITGGAPARIARSLSCNSQAEPFIGEVGVLETRPWVEDRLQHRADARHDLIILLQQGTKPGTRLFHRLHGGFLNDEVRVLARHPAVDEREQDALRENDPAGELQ